MIRGLVSNQEAKLKIHKASEANNWMKVISEFV